MRNDDFTMSAIAKLSLSILALIFGEDMVVAVMTGMILRDTEIR